MANEIQQDNDYQKPISIREAMIHIQNAEYVLPGIQRKFTWDIPRIEALFDSIMQGYPINTLMLWKITDPDIKRKAFRCLVWVSGSGGGGAGRVVWGYGYHVVVHRRPATA